MTLTRYPFIGSSRLTHPHPDLRATCSFEASTARAKNSRLQRRCTGWGRPLMPNIRWCPSSLAKLVNITPITMVYSLLIITFKKVYNQFVFWGAPLCSIRPKVTWKTPSDPVWWTKIAWQSGAGGRCPDSLSPFGTASLTPGFSWRWEKCKKTCLKPRDCGDFPWSFHGFLWSFYGFLHPLRSKLRLSTWTWLEQGDQPALMATSPPV